MTKTVEQFKVEMGAREIKVVDRTPEGQAYAEWAERARKILKRYPSIQPTELEALLDVAVQS